MRELGSEEESLGVGGAELLTLRFPSAVMRSRLQAPQKCSDMDVMKLI